ncbi:hypothetical protein MCNS_43540 [Mycobacterium conspicuum]|uniref:Transposase IS204/IS1001/IS1096/IS1165 zinc-finger domain-containing protein n=1 Tax=Mycobacterium conspicuum TaxID=44010 RepID=A0A7I7YKC2_9MYCO|nr:transposase family protein [Mycobacterium conspicuum]BBZ41291.1 hypothetical protein MCNS_43540 [Mycobacterium conspicuum]
MTIKFKSTFVRYEPSQIVEALVGLKDVRVLAYRRSGPDVELVIEQTVVDRLCPTCGGAGQIKERPTVRYVDLPVYGQPMRLAWRKHRVICRRAGCAGGELDQCRPSHRGQELPADDPLRQMGHDAGRDRSRGF